MTIKKLTYKAVLLSSYNIKTSAFNRRLRGTELGKMMRRVCIELQIFKL